MLELVVDRPHREHMKLTHVGPLRVETTSGQRRRPRRNFTILRRAIDSANSAEKTLIHA